MKKSLLSSKKASIHKLSIDNDLDGGQFFIVDIMVERLQDNKFEFNDSSIELIIISEDLNLITSGTAEQNDWQFLPTNWKNILD